MSQKIPYFVLRNQDNVRSMSYAYFIKDDLSSAPGSSLRE